MNTRSLRFRLILSYAGLLTGIFLLCGTTMYQALSHYLKQSLADSLLRRTQQISASLLAGVEKTGEPFVVDEIKARYAPENYDRFIRLSGRDGTIIYASGRAATFNPDGFPVAAVEPSPRIASLPDGNRLLIVTQEYQAPGGRDYIIESGGPMQPIDTVLSHLMFWLLMGVPVVVLVAVGGGLILVGQALAPVVQIARSAEEITLHNLEGQLPLAPTGDELEQLSLALNRMIARLREAFEQNRRFLADASHELRTPLTALRGELEGAVEQTRHLPELQDKVGSALEEVDRLAKIVQTLFAIARLDAGEAQQEWQRFDLARLAAGTADQMSLLAEDKGISVNCNARQEVEVEGDRARVKQVVVNLLDNAIKYTPPGGIIHLNVRAHGSKAILEVVDTGIGIPAVALPHVFDRFYRVDKARSRDAGGAGLGLAIVKSICTAHGGQVEVESSESRGSRFKVELPLAQPERAKTNL
jgi:heavy metal sensor kinase